VVCKTALPLTKGETWRGSSVHGAGFQLEGRHLVCLVTHLQGGVVQGPVQDWQDGAGAVVEWLEGQDMSVMPDKHRSCADHHPQQS
jgi:hypothetical protein